VAKVLNNLQVTVKNVHVRYEDKVSSPEVSVRSFCDCIIGLKQRNSAHSQLGLRWLVLLLFLLMKIGSLPLLRAVQAPCAR
jgi:hypothetical protein